MLKKRTEYSIHIQQSVTMGDDGLGPKGRLALAAALGTGVVIGAAGLVVYQVCFFSRNFPFNLLLLSG